MGGSLHLELNFWSRILCMISVDLLWHPVMMLYSNISVVSQMFLAALCQKFCKIIKNPTSWVLQKSYKASKLGQTRIMSIKCADLHNLLHVCLAQNWDCIIYLIQSSSLKTLPPASYQNANSLQCHSKAWLSDIYTAVCNHPMKYAKEGVILLHNETGPWYCLWASLNMKQLLQAAHSRTATIFLPLVSASTALCR